MKELTKKDIKRIWLTDTAIHLETTEGKTAKEDFVHYKSLKNASKKMRENYTVTVYGIHWPEIDEDLSFSGFFAPKRENSEIGKIFAEFSQINISAFARSLGISQPLMASYLSGTKKPSVKRKKEIEKQLHELGKELQKIQL